MIQLLINLLTKAYQLEARKHKRAAEKLRAVAVAEGDNAVALSKQAQNALTACREAHDEADANIDSAAFYAAKSQQVNDFFLGNK